MGHCSKTLAASALYISHGGGPLPLLGEPSHREMVDGLTYIVNLFAKPEAIIVVSAHWEAEEASITSAAHPELLYDYSGFPPEAYEIKYPASGNPLLAEKMGAALQNAGIKVKMDESRGLDHGLFVPLKIMYPAADIPCVQLSLVNSLDPAEHIQMGRTLAELAKEKVFVMGSGFSFHNMKAFFSPSTEEIQSMNELFEQWLVATCSNIELKEHDREKRLVQWEDAPAARFCHPREEHLLPLHVCYGVAQSPARRVFSWKIMGKQVSGYLW